jgi:hypothetical protein
MRLAAALAAAAVLAAAGCETGSTRAPTGGGRGVGSGGRTPAGAPIETAPPPEPGEPGSLTILLVEYSGPQAIPRARRLADELTRKGFPDVFVVEGHQAASVCVGRFDHWSDPEAKRMLARVRPIRTEGGAYPFAAVMLMPVPEPAPKNPWPLEEAPGGTYSLHVASWEASGRKRKAQDYAAKLRRQGFPAYVYHGPRLSMVTIGTFGDEVFEDPGAVGKPGVTPKITGPKVLALQKKFPTMRLEGQDAPVPTILVRIPGREPDTASAAAARPDYHLTLVRWDQARMRAQASGTAHSAEELAALVASLLDQLLSHVDPGRRTSVGVAAVVPQNRAASRRNLGEGVEKATLSLLRSRSKWPSVTAYAPAETAEFLTAAGVTYAEASRDPTRLADVPEIEILIGGTITLIESGTP